ncbi:hypothetical protein [Pseudomonas psychrophila]|uniref:hypothetical protein n=1 Tax=Pseudomonas psychrophila TaxID=122355 RepID=UPI00035714CF|nr:hypothetical protein [Pseudomonas psychrophila]EPJ90995.1 hypothetical protein CF149_23456 [Pseudomonas psychrophila]
MKVVEKIKAQKAIDKIQSGCFDESEVETLLLKLRAYSGSHKIFRESADFVAHNDIRDRGLAQESLDSFYLSLRFFRDYKSDDKSVGWGDSIPLYVKKFLKYQVGKCSGEDLKSECKMSASKLLAVIDKAFKEDPKSRTCTLNEAALSVAKVHAINYLTTFIKVEPVFSAEDFLSSFYAVLRDNDLRFSEQIMNQYKDRIILSFVLLFHDAEFKLAGGGTAKCFLGENSLEGGGVYTDHDLIELGVVGESEIPAEGLPSIMMQYVIFNTKLKISDVCHNSLFVRRAVSEATNEARLDFYRGPLHMVDGVLNRVVGH